MYFILEKRIEKARFKQVGIVIADSLERAAEQLNCDIEEMYLLTASCLGCVLKPRKESGHLRHTFFLEEIKEVNSI